MWERSKPSMKFTSSLDARLGHGVVDGSAHATNGAVALEVHETSSAAWATNSASRSLSPVTKGTFIRERLSASVDRGVEELRSVKVVVEDLGLLGVLLVHGRKATVLEQPLEHQAAHVDAPAVGSVIERALVGLRLEAQHCGNAGQVIGDEVLAHNHNLHAGGTNVLLDTRVDAPKLGHVNMLGEEHRALVGNKRVALRVGQGVVLRAVDGVVLTDIEVVGVLADGKVRAVGNVGEALVCRACNHIGVTWTLGLLIGLLCPVARDHEVCLAVRCQVDESGRKEQ